MTIETAHILCIYTMKCDVMLLSYCIIRYFVYQFTIILSTTIQGMHLAKWETNRTRGDSVVLQERRREKRS